MRKENYLNPKLSHSFAGISEEEKKSKQRPIKLGLVYCSLLIRTWTCFLKLPSSDAEALISIILILEALKYMKLTWEDFIPFESNLPRGKNYSSSLKK